MQRIRDGFAGQKMLVLPEEVGGRLAALPMVRNLYLTNIGYFPNAHFHYVQRRDGAGQYILIYCAAGEGWYRLDQRYAVKGGQYFILPPGRGHVYGAAQTHPWTIYWFHFAGQTAGDLWRIYKERHFPTAAIPFSRQRIALFDQLYDTLEKGYSREHILFTNMALGYLFSSFLYPDTFEQMPEREQTDKIDRMIEFMQQNLKRSITLEELAGNAAWSIPHLIATFKSKTGYSPIDYHNRLRIQKACQYLNLSDRRVKEISFALGFMDPYYFSRLFRKIIGVSPSQYKNNIKG